MPSLSVRLLLDARLSGRRVASALRGHDVRAIDEERALDGWTDAAEPGAWLDHTAFDSRRA